MEYFFSFKWLIEVVYPVVGEFLGYLIAFGEVDTVVVDYLLIGNTFSWEVLNVFTGQSTIIYIYSYDELFSLITGLIPSSELLSSLVSLFQGVFASLGHAVYVLFFGLPVNLPLWVSLILVVPRFLLFTAVLKFFENFIHKVT